MLEASVAGIILIDVINLKTIVCKCVMHLNRWKVSIFENFRLIQTYLGLSVKPHNISSIFFKSLNKKDHQRSFPLHEYPSQNNDPWKINWKLKWPVINLFFLISSLKKTAQNWVFPDRVSKDTDVRGQVRPRPMSTPHIGHILRGTSIFSSARKPSWSCIGFSSHFFCLVLRPFFGCRHVTR